jgi:ribokinase
VKPLDGDQITASDAVSRQKALVVVGAINIDMVVAAEVLPAPGETVVGRGPERHGGGKGANAAVAAARAGATALLIGAVGDDETGVVALEGLRDARVDLAGVAVLPQTPTGVALIVVDGSGENQIAVGAGANGALMSSWVKAQLEASIATGARCVLVSTEIPDAAVVAAVRVAAIAGVTCILNTAPPPEAIEELISWGRPLITANAHELDLISRTLDGEGPGLGNTLSDRAVELARRTTRPVIVTTGASGAVLATPEGSTEVFTPPPTTVVDTTGAGDTLNGVLAAGLARGDSLSDALRSAVAAASISVSRAGARCGMPFRDEVDALISPQHDVAPHGGGPLDDAA